MGFEYAQSLYKLERFDQAKAVLEPILAEHKQARGEADQATILVMRLLARVLLGAGDNTAAIDCLETNLAAVKQDPIANADAISH